MLLSQHGITVELPSAWEGRIYSRPIPFASRITDRLAPAEPPPGRHADGLGWPGEVMRPVTHLANFAMPAQRGDFGSGAVGLMGARNVFISLFEYGPESAGAALFEPRGMPSPQSSEFSPSALQRQLPGQVGLQRFFTESGRPFCMYAVLGAASHSVHCPRGWSGRCSPAS